MSSSFLKENWISKLIKNHPIPNHLNCQLKEIIYKDKTIIFVLSDSKHFINAELTQKSIDTFTSETDIPFLEMKGCYIIIDEYTTKISDNKLTLVVDKFTYFGNECAIEGTPQDISVLYEKEQFLFDNEYFTKINELISKEDDCLKKVFRKINKNNWFMENIFCENFKLDFD